MKILNIIATVNPESGGPLQGLVSSAPALAKHGCKREIVSLDHPDDPWVKSCPLPVHAMGIRHPSYPAWRRRIPFLRYGYSPHLVPWLKANAKNYDAVFVNGLWNYCALGARRALPGRARYFVYPHGMLDPWLRNFPIKTLGKQVSWWLAEGPLLAGAQEVLFTTEEEKILARDIFWPYRCRERVVPYGALDAAGDPQKQIEAFRKLVPALDGRRYLLFLSRIHPKKGCDLLVEAFAAVADQDPGLDLVMAGPDNVGWVAKLKEVAKARGIADRLHWPGMLRGDEKWGAFRGSEAFVLPSHQENFGIVVAESMACGRPVLTTFKVNTWREIEECGAGLVAEDNVEGITDLLRRFLALSPERKTAMGQAARQGFIDKFDLNTQATQLIEIFGMNAA
ncbi:glycosyltransferase [Beijerinckia mobilis]|uniref:glycosyltransferase n=1 Tax=Beijerinckia mobilis TaxID=231434 RepID=UPI00054D8A81|nr:glycosyltransferase [Beijerinckia mobilis]